MTEVILLEPIPHLGKLGDIVKVKPGYARNYLLATQKALRASKENKKIFEEKKKNLEVLNEENKKAAFNAMQNIEGRIEGIVRAAGQSGYLYGSVSPKDIADLFHTKECPLEKHHVVLTVPIKTLGAHQVMVALHPNITCYVTVIVGLSVEEVAIQKKSLEATRSQDSSENSTKEAPITPPESPLDSA